MPDSDIKMRGRLKAWFWRTFCEWFGCGFRFVHPQQDRATCPRCGFTCYRNPIRPTPVKEHGDE